MVILLLLSGATLAATELNVRSNNNGTRIRFIGEHDYYHLFTLYDLPWEDEPSIDGGAAIEIETVELIVGPLRRKGIAKTLFVPLSYGARSADHLQHGELTLEQSIRTNYDYGVMISYDSNVQILASGALLDEGRGQLQAAFRLPFDDLLAIQVWSSYIALNEQAPDTSWYSDELPFNGLDLFHNALVIAIDRPGVEVYGSGMLQLGLIQAPQGAVTIVADIGTKPHYWGGKMAWSTLLYLDEYGDFNDEGLMGALWYRYNPAPYLDTLFSLEGTIYGRQEHFDTFDYDFEQNRLTFEGSADGEIPFGKEGAGNIIQWKLATNYIIDNRVDATYGERLQLKPSIGIGNDFIGCTFIYTATVEDTLFAWQRLKAELVGGNEVFEVAVDAELYHEVPHNEITIGNTLSVSISPTWGRLFARLSIAEYPLVHWEDIVFEIGLDIDM